MNAKYRKGKKEKRGLNEAGVCLSVGGGNNKIGRNQIKSLTWRVYLKAAFLKTITGSDMIQPETCAEVIRPALAQE